jgi:hypothetical protein
MASRARFGVTRVPRYPWLMHALEARVEQGPAYPRAIVRALSLACLFVSACTTQEGFVYTVSTGVDDLPGRPAPAMPPHVFINGARVDSFTATYPDVATLQRSSPLVELRYEDTVLAAYAPGPDVVDPCGGEAGQLVGYETDLWIRQNGDIGYSDDRQDCTNGGGGGDGGSIDTSFCPSECGSGSHCTLRAKLLEPLFSDVGCAPIGPKQAGGACSYIADPAGAYSDCGEGLLCVGGTCRVRCPDDPAKITCGACEYIEGMPLEITVCSAVTRAL